MPRGGTKKGAGRPRGEPTIRIRIPIIFLTKIRILIKKLFEEKNDNDKS